MFPRIYLLHKPTTTGLAASLVKASTMYDTRKVGTATRPSVSLETEVPRKAMYHHSNQTTKTGPLVKQSGHREKARAPELKEDQSQRLHLKLHVLIPRPQVKHQSRVRRAACHGQACARPSLLPKCKGLRRCSCMVHFPKQPFQIWPKSKAG